MFSERCSLVTLSSSRSRVMPSIVSRRYVLVQWYCSSNSSVAVQWFVRSSTNRNSENMTYRSPVASSLPPAYHPFALKLFFLTGTWCAVLLEDVGLVQSARVRRRLQAFPHERITTRILVAKNVQLLSCVLRTLLTGNIVL